VLPELAPQKPDPRLAAAKKPSARRNNLAVAIRKRVLDIESKFAKEN
jgi:hypothetical protein